SPSQARRPAKNTSGRSGSAKDVWTFYEQKGSDKHEKRECVFCRQQHATDSHAKLTTFSGSTSSGVLRKHLYENHLDAWVEGCDKLKITIKAKEAIKHVEEYRNRKQHTTGTAPNPKPETKRTAFSQEAFVDAIVEFIVGDDQVCFYRSLEHHLTFFFLKVD
ncbi:hypothetical protein FB451DRAFT_1043180, partial [Mycena latifolia]